MFNFSLVNKFKILSYVFFFLFVYFIFVTFLTNLISTFFFSLSFIITLFVTSSYNVLKTVSLSFSDFTFLYQDSFTYQCDGIIHLHNLLFCLIFGIVIFVLLSLLFAYFEYRLLFRSESILNSFLLFSNPYNVIFDNSNRLFLVSLLVCKTNFFYPLLQDLLAPLLAPYKFFCFDLLYEDACISDDQILHNSIFVPNNIILFFDKMMDYTSVDFWLSIYYPNLIFSKRDSSYTRFPFRMNVVKFYYKKTIFNISGLSRSMSFFFKYCFQITRICHGTLLETIWTTIPSLILLTFSIPSFILLYALDETCDSFECIKIIGNQWYWNYDLLLNNTINFDSYMVTESNLKLGELRLLEVDCPLIVSTNVSYRLLISSLDVLHCWTLPSIGVKVDACPGRVNLGYLLLKNSGQIYGQCSEICGVGHGFMPISIISISASIPLYA